MAINGMCQGLHRLSKWPELYATLLNQRSSELHVSQPRVAILTEFVPKLAGSGPILADAGPILAEIGPTEIGLHQPDRSFAIQSVRSRIEEEQGSRKEKRPHDASKTVENPWHGREQPVVPAAVALRPAHVRIRAEPRLRPSAQAPNLFEHLARAGQSARLGAVSSDEGPQSTQLKPRQKSMGCAVEPAGAAPPECAPLVGGHHKCSLTVPEQDLFTFCKLH